MERMMLRRLTYFLGSNNLLPREQYGFRRGHSTEDQILYYCQCVRDTQNLKKTDQSYSRVAFLDLTKAFDTVWRNKLILKMLDVFGIKGKALPWISYFLKSRVIRVKYNKSLSKDFKLSQGVPQGLVLSPMVFSMFLAGVEKLITENSSIGLFTDDIVLWHSSHDIPSIEANISQFLSRVNDFATNHKLSFNLTKSVTSFFTTNRHLYKYQPTVFIKDQNLLYVKHPNYLGFTLDQEIFCNWHIEDLINKSRKRLNILKYISGRDWGADVSTLKTTYTTLIRPVLEFGSAIFFITSDSNLKKLERIQLSAAKIITGLRNSCPNNLVLHECDLQPLNMRRNYCF
ncbi:probable RNA-directed DNA polymerase from transposon X-element [Trichonephila clavipes]|uniref:Probable RNA-directed DNA polymerase from transposon X-element n=1 Tax=Trichonephila clavipes TaxID=2585209 RepID=A0A8X6RQU5_TRICX|nr:probable RNA-directed DNA polymerase from transposon X-element [Trichonephila clavipes]